jgi:hypothetical protein
MEKADNPVVSWSTIRLFPVVATINKWYTIKIDFIMAYTQAPIARPTYMELPPGVTWKGMHKRTQCLKILKSIYGGKDSRRAWYLYLKNVLVSLGYQQSNYRECVFYKESTIFFTYTDNGVLLNHNKETPQECLNQLQMAFEIEVKGDLLVPWHQD